MENYFKKVRLDYSESRRDKDHTAKIYSAVDMCRDFNALGYSISSSRIKKLESDTYGVNVDKEILLAYHDKFNVSTDWLLGISPTPSLDENEQMISKTTGLTNVSIKKLKKYKQWNIEVLNRLIENDSILELTRAIIDNVQLDEKNSLSCSTNELTYDGYEVLKKLEKFVIELSQNKEIIETARNYKVERLAEKYDPEIVKEVLAQKKRRVNGKRK